VPQHWSSGDLEIYLLKNVRFKVTFGVICHECGHHQIIKDGFGERPSEGIPVPTQFLYISR
jgi:hypothetical protein